MKKNNSIDLSILIVNWNGGEVFKKCLKSVDKECKNTKLNYEIIIVDNNSNDLDLNFINKFKKIKLFKNSKNLLFSKATNQTVKFSKGKILFILNNDIILKKNTIKILYKKILYLNGDAVVPQLLYPNKNIQHSISGIPKIRDIVFTSIGLNKISKKFDRWMLNSFDYLKEQSIKDQPAFSALMIKRKTWEKTGNLDKDLPLLWNDVDWFFRFFEKNLKCFYIPSAKCVHYHGYSVNKNKFTKIIISSKSMYYYFCKNFNLNSIQKVLLRIICIYTFLIRIVREFFLTIYNK